MAISMSRRKSKSPRRPERTHLCFCKSFFCNLLSKIPTAILLLVLVFLWSSSTTIISGNIVHVCVSSRKLNNLYCLSAGTHPSFTIPVPPINNGSNITVSDANFHGSVKGIMGVFSPRIDSNIKEGVDVVSPDNNGNVKEVVRNVPTPVVTGRISEDNEDEVSYARKVVEEQLELQRSWRSEANHGSCDGRKIFVYDMPSKFNKDLIGQCGEMIPWVDFCKYFSNDALGEPIAKLGKGWFRTHQYSLEPIFHTRILNHPCRVHDENEAKLFYVPYYGGIDILRWHFRNVSDDVKDSLSLELLKWLDSKKTWIQNSGKDHVFVLGKISWDFRRKNYSSWGTRFLNLEPMQNPMKLLIERQPWEVNEIGIPHPTYFHPHSDDDIVAWQLKIIRATRRSLVSFAGAARPGQPESIRSALISQCNSTNHDKCKFLDCNSGGCDQPESIINLFMDSEFCLQPPGDSPTRKSVFDSLVSGCIPVLFDPFTAYYQYPWHLPEEHGKYSVFVDQEEVRKMEVNVVERLMNVSEKEREGMRRYIVYELLPGLVYGDPNSQLQKFQDAFSITVNNLLDRVLRLL